MRILPKTFTFVETADSRKSHKNEDWDPEYINYIFSTSAKCSNNNCTEQFYISGTGGIEPGYDDEYGSTLEDYFRPNYCIPMPIIIELPKKCPDDVKQDINEAFKLFWGHPPSCANALRYALEKLLTHQGVPTQTPSKKNPQKSVDLSLHQRITFYIRSEPTAGAQLMALKWLGNTGSHGHTINLEDLLDAFEILEHTLAEIIENKSKKIAKLADELTKKHS